MVKNPSRFSGATGLRQNIQRASAPKLPPPPTPDYAGPEVQRSQAFYEADASVVPGQSGMEGIPPNQQPGYDEHIKTALTTGQTAENMGLTDSDHVTNEIDDRRGGLYGWHQDNQNKEDIYHGVDGFHWLANVFQSDPNKKFIVNPDISDGSSKFITTGAAAVLQADIKAKEAAAADKKLADQLAVSNSAHTGGYDSFYIGGNTSKVNPNQVKFDQLRMDTLTKDETATGVMQDVDGVSTFQPWTKVAQNYGPNVSVNYGLTGNPMNPSPASGPSGTMTISRSMSEQSHAGIQTSINKQQMNRDFNLTLKTWQSEYLLGPRDESSKVKAKAFIDAQKAKYLGYEDRGGHGFGGYGTLFGKELDKRYYNLFESPNAPGKKIPSKIKLTIAEKIKIKINNGTATQADLKKYATLTQTPGNISGYSNTISGKVKTNDAITGYTDLMNGNSFY